MTSFLVFSPGDVSGGTHCISMGRDVLTKGVLFLVSVWNGVVFHWKKSGKGFKYTFLERGSCLSGKGMVNYLSQIKILYTP